MKAIFLAVLLAAFATATEAADSHGPDLCRSVLKAGERLSDLKDLDGQARKWFEKSSSASSATGCSLVDFYGNRHLGFGVIVVDAKQRASLKVFASENGALKKVDELDLTDQLGIAFLETVAKSEATLKVSSSFEADARPAEATVRGLGDVLRVSYVGKGEVIYYADSVSRKIESLQTRD